MGVRFNPPPNWPAPPSGWTPPPGWQPDPAWGPPPSGWQLWVEERQAANEQAPSKTPPEIPLTSASNEPAAVASGSSMSGEATSVEDAPTEMSIPRFGARAKAKELAQEVSALRTELARLRAEMGRLGVLDVVDLEARREALATELAAQADRIQREQTEHVARLADAAKASEAASRESLRAVEEQQDLVAKRLHELRQQVVVTEDTALLQEAGVYEYRHPLDDAVAYQAELARLKESIKAMTRKDGGAVWGTTNWNVNGSAAQGRKMVRDFSKLMLRAYNAEADNLVRGLKPYKLDSAIDRLNKVVVTIAKLGSTMDIHITDAYHKLRIRELELTADYAEKLAQEKEREKEEKARLREERKAQEELERERKRLEKERTHYENAMQALLRKDDQEGAARLAGQLAEIDAAIENVDYRVANVRAGYVYVISNVGSFGEQMVKIGMTRRLEPLDRVRELSDASVPFKFDVHALFFSDDAVGIESKMHALLAAKRVNRVNLRREFFYATPQEVRAHLVELTGDLLHFEELPEALEYHQSQNQTAGAPASV
jgi:hypothetical protein